MKFGSRLTRRPSSDGSVGSGPLHLLKKVGFSLRRSDPEPLEYATCKADLDHTIKSLGELLVTCEASRKAWREVARCKIEFGERFVNGVGSGSGNESSHGSDDGIGAEGGIGVRLVGEGCRGFEREVGGLMGDEGVSYEGLKEVKRYVDMLKGIQLKYKIVAKAKSEYEFYAKKLKGLEGKAGKEEALVRTRGKYELSRRMFNGYINGMVRMIQIALANKETAFRAVFDAHYMLQAKLFRIMGSHEQQIHTRATADEASLAELSLCTGLEDPNKKLDEITVECQKSLNHRPDSQERIVNAVVYTHHPLLTAPPAQDSHRSGDRPPPISPYSGGMMEIPSHELPTPSAPTPSTLELGAH